MGRKVGSIVVAGAVILGACTGSEATTTTGQATTTTRPSTTTAEPLPSEACSGEPHTPVDPSALAIESVTGDMDGDGFDDTITGHSLGDPDPTGASAAVLHIELASGWGTAFQVDSLDLEDTSKTAQPRRMVIMSDDPLVVAGVAGSSERQRFAFFVFDDCRLRVVTTADGAVPDMWLGGGRTGDVWFTCQSDQVSMVKLATSDPDAEPMNYGAGVSQTYRYADGTFTWTGSSELDVALPATYEEMTGLFPPCIG